MSKRAAHRARAEARIATHAEQVAATAIKLDEVLRDPQAIAAAMKDTVEVVSEEVPAEEAGWEPGTLGLVGGKLATRDLEDAMRAWGLTAEDVIGWRGFEPEQESALVTAAGVKVFWPQDRDRVLTDADKGRTQPQPTGEAGGEGRFARKGGAFQRD